MKTHNRLYNHLSTIDTHHYSTSLTYRLDSYSFFITFIILKLSNHSPIQFSRAQIYNLLANVNKFLDLSSQTPQVLPYLVELSSELLCSPSFYSRLEPIAEVISDTWNNVFHRPKIHPEVTQLNDNSNEADEVTTSDDFINNPSYVDTSEGVTILGNFAQF